MSKENWSRIEHLYHHASELNGKERQAYLDLELGDDKALRREVESLLANYEEARSFLETRAPSRRRASDEAPVANMARPSLTIGAHLGPYEILSLIGSGGMGEVYRGRDTRLQRTVAIKVLSATVVHDPERRRRFLQEARAASALNHPSIVTLHDIGSDKGIDFFVMEYVPERPLDALIASKRLAFAEVLDYGIQIASALAAAHAAGIIHRDIKPANVMVTGERQVKVLDFGLARWREDAAVDENAPTLMTSPAPLTQAGQVMGTLAYMSPEQARGEGLDARTDLFSFGAVLYEMATGRPAFPNAFDRTPPPLTGIDASLRRIILKLIQPDRDLRYETAIDVIADLKRLQTKQSRRRQLLLLAGTAAVIASIAIVSVWFRPAPLTSQAQWVQLTNLPDPVSQPALSPDGRMLTFIRGAGTFYTPGQIYVKTLPDGEPKQLTHDARSKLGPVFSPDGSRIAYTTVDGDFKWDTWTAPVLNGEPVLWLRNASGLTWIDKQKVMFSEIKKDIHMAIVTSNESRIGARDVYVPARENGMAHRSFISPDGNWALVAEMDGAWLACSLVRMDGKSPRRPLGPAGAPCTYAGWSPDGNWMYLNSSAGGRFHIWRLRFPNGQPEQITSGPTEEEGIAVATDGRSLITAVGLKQRSVFLQDATGDRQISLEGYALRPRITPDGKRLCYLILKGVSATTDPIELWMTDLATGRTEPLLPGFSLTGIAGFDISPDGQQAAVSTRDANGNRLWIVRLDGQSPPRQIANAVPDRVLFWAGDEIMFQTKEGNAASAYRVRQDGTELRKAIEQPISQLQGLSPDGQWLVTWTGETVGYPLGAGSPFRIFGRELRLRWSWDKKSLFLQFSSTGAGGVTAANGKTYIVPLPPGQMFPKIPAGGFHSLDEIAALPGVRVIDSEDGTPGPTPDTYAFSRETTQRNLYRIPLR
jgi:serine/threonine protein kinase/Tol biopolymer transport system component